MIGVIALGYPRRVRHLSRMSQRLLLASRVGAVLLLLFLMLRPSLILTSQDSGTAVMYVVSDHSRSMQTPDAPGSLTRMEAQRQLLRDTDTSLSKFNDSVEIRRRKFAQSLQPWDPKQIEANGDFTSLSNCLEELLRESDSSKKVYIVLSSDGRQAAWGDDDRSPMPYAKLLAKQDTPVYTVVHGTSDVVANGLDVSLTELDITRDVFVRNVVPVQVRLKAQGASGRKVIVRVFLEAPASGESISGEMIAVPVDQQSRPIHEFICDGDSIDNLIHLDFVPQTAGEFKVAVEVAPLDGEVRLTNNRLETLIRVRKGGIRVVYFDKLRAESRWVKSITVSSRVQLDTMTVYSGDLANRNQFEDSWFKPGNVDAFIIGDVPADAIGAARLEAIRRCCRRSGAGLIMTGGIQNFGVGGYQNHRISELFPVEMAETFEQLTGEVVMYPTETGLRHSVMQIAPPNLNKDRWKDLPPLNGATLLKPLALALVQILATTENGTPLLVAHETETSRVMAFAGDSTWQWYVQRGWGATAFQRFWRQTIFWLTKKEQDSEGPVWVSAEPRDLMPGQHVDLTFGARDRQGMQLVDAAYEIIVTKPDGTTQSVLASRDGNQGIAQFTEADAPGDYLVRVEATHNGVQHGWDATRFLVNARDPELDNPSADPEMMRELANASGGSFLTSAELLERLDQWSTKGLPGHQLDRIKRLNLWDNWYLLFLFAGLMTFEWVLRKQNGLV